MEKFYDVCYLIFIYLSFFYIFYHKTLIFIYIISDDEKNIIETSGGIISADTYKLIPSVNGNFAFISVKESQNTVEIYNMYIRPATNDTVGPYMIYKDTAPNQV